jgi:hypothetical protein
MMCSTDDVWSTDDVCCEDESSVCVVVIGCIDDPTNVDEDKDELRPVDVNDVNKFSDEEDIISSMFEVVSIPTEVGSTTAVVSMTTAEVSMVTAMVPVTTAEVVMAPDVRECAAVGSSMGSNVGEEVFSEHATSTTANTEKTTKAA